MIRSIIRVAVITSYLGVSVLANSANKTTQPPLLEGLSPFWAQELIGADLIDTQTIGNKVQVGMLDLSFSGYSQILKGRLAPDLKIAPSTFYSPHGAAVAALLGSEFIGVGKI